MLVVPFTLTALVVEFPLRLMINLARWKDRWDLALFPELFADLRLLAPGTILSGGELQVVGKAMWTVWMRVCVDDCAHHHDEPDEHDTERSEYGPAPTGQPEPIWIEQPGDHVGQATKEASAEEQLGATLEQDECVIGHETRLHVVGTIKSLRLGIPA